MEMKNKPEPQKGSGLIAKIDSSGWTGKKAGIIRVLTLPNGAVEDVRIRIRDLLGNIIESGPAACSERNRLWSYLTTRKLPHGRSSAHRCRGGGQPIVEQNPWLLGPSRSAIPQGLPNRPLDPGFWTRSVAEQLNHKCNEHTRTAGSIPAVPDSNSIPPAILPTQPPARQPVAPPQVGVLGEVELLTEAEQADFQTCEAVISMGWQTFVEVGLAFARIRDGRLHKVEFDTFEAYCRVKWRYGRHYVNRVISAAQVFRHLVTNCHQNPPDHESQVRPLIGLPLEQAQKAWESAVAMAGSRRITARQVQNAVNGLQLPAQRSRSHLKSTNPPSGSR